MIDVPDDRDCGVDSTVLWCVLTGGSGRIRSVQAGQREYVRSEREYVSTGNVASIRLCRTGSSVA